MVQRVGIVAYFRHGGGSIGLAPTARAASCEGMRAADFAGGTIRGAKVTVGKKP
jgi:hypothetical protein